MAKMNNNEKLKVLVAIEDAATRHEVKLLLDSTADMHVIGEVKAGDSIKDVLDRLPDVVLMEGRINGMADAPAIRRKLPQVRIIALTEKKEDDCLLAALMSDLDGYCLNENLERWLPEAIRAVVAGNTVLGPGIAGCNLEAFKRLKCKSDASYAPAQSVLTNREVDVLKLVAEGRKNHQIAEELLLNVETIKTHVRQILFKLNASDRTEAAVKAVRAGLI